MSAQCLQRASLLVLDRVRQIRHTCCAGGVAAGVAVLGSLLVSDTFIRKLACTVVSSLSGSYIGAFFPRCENDRGVSSTWPKLHRDVKGAAAV